ncbi:hypothetical protein [Comamonas odontotermitis]|nr:hypothetical protein [Comamonas odontotermitis]UBB16067.1 hypothetical protein LAD35_14675 [Comamonas odontotermitis]
MVAITVLQKSGWRRPDKARSSLKRVVFSHYGAALLAPCFMNEKHG